MARDCDCCERVQAEVVTLRSQLQAALASLAKLEATVEGRCCCGSVAVVQRMCA